MRERAGTMDLKPFRDAYTPELRAGNSLWIRHVVRPVSYVFAWFFQRAGFSANQVTYLSIAVILAAFGCFLIDDGRATVTAALLVNFWMLLDCVDGNLARAGKRRNVYGAFVDAMGGYSMLAFVFLGVGVAAERETAFLAGFVPYGSFIVMGALASVTSLLSRIIYQKFVAVEYERGISKGPQSSKPSGLIYQLDVNIGMSGVFMPALLAAALSGALRYLISFYFLYFLVVLIYTYYRFISRVERGGYRG